MNMCGCTISQIQPTSHALQQRTKSKLLRMGQQNQTIASKSNI